MEYLKCDVCNQTSNDLTSLSCNHEIVTNAFVRYACPMKRLLSFTPMKKNKEK